MKEFCRVLFDAIEESCKGTKQETFIRDLYEGNLISYVTCLKCKFESQRVDKFLDLSLTVKNQYSNSINDSIEKALLCYLKPEFLDNDNKYFCEKCNEKVEAVKGIRIQSLPKIITFHLNRFELDYETLFRKKINNLVTFPYFLDMKEFLKEYSEIQQTEVKPNQELYKKICSITKESSGKSIAGVHQEQILKNIKKGSNTYELFEEQNKPKQKIFDDFPLKVFPIFFTVILFIFL